MTAFNTAGRSQATEYSFATPPTLPGAFTRTILFCPTGSLFADCDLQQGLKITGKTILSTKGLNWPNCAVACFDNSECNFWTHRQNSEGKNLCVLKSSASEKGGKRESGSISGPKACGKFGEDVLSSANLVHVNKISTTSKLPQEIEDEKLTSEAEDLYHNSTGRKKTKQ